ncbi:hypothetical protein [Streptomyces sp. NPDC004721]
MDDREELERLVVELVLARVDVEPPGPAMPWRERIEVMVRRLRDAVAAHPAIVPLAISHRHHSLGVLRWSEAVLFGSLGARRLSEGGLKAHGTPDGTRRPCRRRSSRARPGTRRARPGRTARQRPGVTG